MTVSLALRNHRSLPETTRRRIRSAAEALGYRPDPVLSALNRYRHQRLFASPGNVLAYVTRFEKRLGWQASPFYRRAFQGARDRAQSLGYKLEHVWLAEPGITNDRFVHVLESRGIRGFVVAPLPDSGSRLDLPWDRFSCVAIGPSLVSPALHSACGDQYQAAILALQRLARIGYRRIGLLLDPEADRRHQGKYQAAFAITRTAKAPRPLVASQPSDGDIRAWLRREKPEVVVSESDANYDRLRRLGMRVPRKIGYASLVRSGRKEISGVETFPEQIAGAAVIRLQQMLNDNETGVPELPTCTFLPGKWVDGATTRR